MARFARHADGTSCPTGRPISHCTEAADVLGLMDALPPRLGDAGRYLTFSAGHEIGIEIIDHGSRQR